MSLTGKIKAILNMQGNQIKNVATPTADGDVAIKSYADNLVSGGKSLVTSLNANLATEIQTVGDIDLFSFTVPADTMDELDELHIWFSAALYDNTTNYYTVNGPKIQAVNDGNTAAATHALIDGAYYCENTAYINVFTQSHIRVARVGSKLYYDKEAAQSWMADEFSLPGTSNWQDIGLAAVDFTKDTVFTIQLTTNELTSKVCVLGGISVKLLG